MSDPKNELRDEVEQAGLSDADLDEAAGGAAQDTVIIQITIIED